MEEKDKLTLPEDGLEDNSSFITLIDDNNNDVSFEVLDYFNYNEKDYNVLLPFDETDDEVVILEVFHNGEDDEYNSIEDEQILISVFEEFKNRNADEFDFED